MEANTILPIAELSSGKVLLIAVPVIVVLAVALIVATTVSRQRQATGSLTREAKKADRSEPGAGLATTDDMSEEARARFSETKQSLEPAGAGTSVVTAAGGLIRFG